MIELPKVAGVYFQWESDETNPVLAEDQDIYFGNIENGANRDKWWLRLESMMKRNVPIFVFDQSPGSKNTVRMVYDINVKRRTFRVTPTYDPKDIINLPGIYRQHQGQEEKRRAVMRVFDAIAPKLKPKEQNEYRPHDTEQNPDLPPIEYTPSCTVQLSRSRNGSFRWGCNFSVFVL